MQKEDMMNLYAEVKKGPPKWLVRGLALLIVLMVGLQIGMYKERSKRPGSAGSADLAKKDAVIDRLKIALADCAQDLEVEQAKLAILLCESGVKHEGVWGDGGRSYGICQFQYRTFDWMRRSAGRPELRWKNRNDQLWLLDWALRNGHGKYWTCYGKSTTETRRHGERQVAKR
jgi:hypothetical protein